MANAMKENVAVDIGTIGGTINTQSRNSAIGNTLSKPFNKITVNNVLNDSNAMKCLGNSQNTIIRKINDFGMFGAVKNAAAHKRPLTNISSGLARKLPICKVKLNEGNKQQEKVKLTQTMKKAKVVKDSENFGKKQDKLTSRNQLGDNTTIMSDLSGKALKSAGTPGRKGMPLPQAVARRNARERNRVKQVNNGFAALRQHIPEDVSETFESNGSSGRGTSKKLSKVETLRMAVEYIRSLERLLGYEFPESGLSVTPSLCSSSSGEESFMAIKDEYETLEDNCEDSLSNFDLEDCNYNSTDLISAVEEAKSSAIEKLSNLTTLNGLQYVRISGTNTYQLITSKAFPNVNGGSASNSSIDDDQFNALIDPNYPIARIASTDLHMDSTRTPQDEVDLGTTLPSDNSVLTGPNIITTATTTSTAVSAPGMSEKKLENYKTNNTECVKFALNSPTSKSLSRSILEALTSSTDSSSLRRQQQQFESRRSEPPSLTVTTMSKTTTRLPPMPSVSPAITKELLLQTCATTGAVVTTAGRHFVVSATTSDRSAPQQQQQIQLIKQEFNDEEFVNASGTMEPIAEKPLRNNICYAPIQQQQQQLLDHAGLAISTYNNSSSDPNGNSAPIIPNMESPSLQNFYEHDNNSFYDGAVALKKEFDHILALDTSSTTAGLSDESMIDAIDWWEAHTPKPNGDSPIL